MEIDENHRPSLIEQSKAKDDKIEEVEAEQRRKRRERFGILREEAKTTDWNFGIPWFVKVDENSIPKKLFPSASLEFFRSKKVAQLFSYFKTAIKTKFNAEPLEAFHLWLVEQYSIPLTERPDTDPLIPAPERVKVDSIKQEILKQIPASFYISWYHRKNPTLKTLEIFENYIRSAHPIVEEHLKTNASDSVAKQCLETLTTVSQDLKLVKRVTAEVIHSFSHSLQKHCVPFFESVFGPKVDDFFAEFTKQALTFTEQIKSFKIDPKDEVFIDEKKYSCTVRYGLDEHEISKSSFRKLKSLYELHSKPEDPELKHFAACLYCCVRRYQTLFGHENNGSQASAPATAFSFVVDNFGVSHETFASPFNCYVHHYCSAFPDVDVFFGSVGSFFDFKPTLGSFQVGVPNVYQVMNMAAKRVEKLLEGAVGPMNFVVFSPDWTEAEFIDTYSKSRFKRAEVVCQPFEYCYINGNQHLAKNNHGRYFLAPFGNRIFILQNDLGAKEWPVTEDKLKLMVESFTQSKGLASRK